jgi:hypothetical protein
MNSTLRVGFLSLLLATCIGLDGTECHGVTLTFSSGNHTFSSVLSSSDVPPVIAQGTTQLTVTGTVIANSGNDEPALLARDSAAVTVIGGRLSAQSAGVDGVKPRAGIRLLGNSRLIFHSGQIDESGSGINVDRAAILAEDNSQVQMFGGLAQAMGSGFDDDRSGILARGNSRVTVFGGSIVALGASEGAHHELRALDNATITVYGSGFNLPLGPISATSGRLTGNLLNGSPIDWSFSRGPGANIILVPEPSAEILILLGAATVATIPHVLAPRRSPTRLRMNAPAVIWDCG